MNQPIASAVPDHVPEELVRPFDFYAAPGMNQAPHATLAKLHDGPRIFWTPVEGWFSPGAWVPTRYADIREILTNPDIFSAQKSVRFSALIGDDWDLIPAELDPPLHGQYRAILSPLFGPRRMSGLEGKIRAHAENLVGRLEHAAGCDFMQAFGRPFPILLFLELMGLPTENFDNFVLWADELLHGADFVARQHGAVAIRDYLQAEITSRRKAPRDDVLTELLAAEIEERKLTERELMGIAFLLFGGGVDTVTSSLGFYFKFLAENQNIQSLLRDDPSRIAHAVEEFLRMFGIVTVNRCVTRDTDIAGVRMKKGDWVLVSTALGSLDPTAFPAPLAADFGRKPNSHATFSLGPHFCLGAHLARREITIGLETWLGRLPAFRLSATEAAVVHGGSLVGVDRLPLVWH